MEYPRSLRLLSCALGWVGYVLHSVLLFYSAWRGVWPIPIPTGVGLGIGIPVAVTGLVIYIMAATEFRSWAWATGQPVLLIRDGLANATGLRGNAHDPEGADRRKRYRITGGVYQRAVWSGGLKPYDSWPRSAPSNTSLNLCNRTFFCPVSTYLWASAVCSNG